MVVSGSLDFTIRVWNLESGVCTFILDTYKFFQTSEMDSLKFANEDKTLVLQGRDGSRRTWTCTPPAATGEPLVIMMQVMETPSLSDPSAKMLIGPKRVDIAGGVLTVGTVHDIDTTLFIHEYDFTAICGTENFLMVGDVKGNVLSLETCKGDVP